MKCIDTCRCGLAFFIESHHDDRRPITFDKLGVFDEELSSKMQRQSKSEGRVCKAAGLRTRLTSSPTFNEIELKRHLPCRHSRPPIHTSNLEESTTTGILHISGSVAMRLQNFLMQSSPSSMPSSKLTNTHTHTHTHTCIHAHRSADAQRGKRLRFSYHQGAGRRTRLGFERSRLPSPNRSLQ